MKGGELRKLIDASLKVPQMIKYFDLSSSLLNTECEGCFDAAIRVVLQSPKRKKKKRKGQNACSMAVATSWWSSSYHITIFNQVEHIEVPS